MWGRPCVEKSYTKLKIQPSCALQLSLQPWREGIVARRRTHIIVPPRKVGKGQERVLDVQHAFEGERVGCCSPLGQVATLSASAALIPQCVQKPPGDGWQRATQVGRAPARTIIAAQDAASVSTRLLVNVIAIPLPVGVATPRRISRRIASPLGPSRISGEELVLAYADCRPAILLVVVGAQAVAQIELVEDLVDDRIPWRSAVGSDSLPKREAIHGGRPGVHGHLQPCGGQHCWKEVARMSQPSPSRASLCVYQPAGQEGSDTHATLPQPEFCSAQRSVAVRLEVPAPMRPIV
eukprot:scaffold30769_cov71-Phaeocystis_antarctica.AAC.12